MGSGKCGSALPSSAIFRISAKVWPEPSNSRSARAGLKAMETCCPAVSSSDGVGEGHRGIEAVGRRALPRHVHALRVGQRDRADGAEPLQGVPALRARLVVCAERAWDRRGTAGEQDHDLAFHIEAGKVVMLQFRDLQAVAGKHQRRLDAGRRVDAHAEGGLIAERHGHGFALRHQREARLRFVDAARAEGNGLQVAGGAGRLEPRLLEVVRDVLGGLQMLGAAGLAATHAVVGQRLDVRKPAGFGRGAGRGQLSRL